MEKNVNLNENNIIKKLIFYSTIMVVIILFIIFFLDIINIGNFGFFKKLTTKYDWFGIFSGIISGLISGLCTFIGIYITLKHERKLSYKKDIEDRKRNNYSYLTLTDNPVILTISLDSVFAGCLVKNQGYLIGENIDVVGSNFFYIELSFKNINNYYPSAVLLKKLTILYNPEIKFNNKTYAESLDLCVYQRKYIPISIDNNCIVKFNYQSLVNKIQIENLNKYLECGKSIDIIADVNFINLNGIITEAQYTATLILKKEEKKGDSMCVGSNKRKVFYASERTSFIVKNIDYLENYSEIIFGKR